MKIIKNNTCLKVSRKTVSGILINAFVYIGLHGAKMIFVIIGIITFGGYKKLQKSYKTLQKVSKIVCTQIKPCKRIQKAYIIT